MAVVNFKEEIQIYALANGFEEIPEIDIVKPEYREKRLSNPYYSGLFRKEVNDHIFYILICKELPPDQTFTLRIYNKYSEVAPRGEFRMKIDEFLEYNNIYRKDKTPFADIIRYSFNELYIKVLNHKEGKS